MKRAFVDANVILRFLTGQPPEQAEQARRLFEAVEQGRTTLWVKTIVVAEVVWVLESFYGFPKSQIARILQGFLLHEGLRLPDKEGVLQALALYAQYNVDFADALLSVRMQRVGTPALISFDRDFDRLPGVQRFTPDAWQATLASS